MILSLKQKILANLFPLFHFLKVNHHSEKNEIIPSQPEKSFFISRNNLKFLLIVSTLLLSNASIAQTTFSEQAASWGINTSGSKDGGHSFADYDGDGDLDLLVNSSDWSVFSKLYRNNGNNTYTDVTSSLAPSLLLGVRERVLIWGDVNNDGRLDFLRNTSTSSPRTIEIYIQSSGGVFGDGVGGSAPINVGPNTYDDVYVSDGLNTEGAGFVDFDGDGDLDIIFDNHNFGVDILRNNYINHLNGTVVNPSAANLFTHATPGTTTALGLNQSATDGDYGSFTDVNNDGWVDIFMRKRDENDFFLNQGGTFTNGSDLAQASNGNKGAVALYDFDNDGDFDAFWTENGLNQIFRNDGAGVWTPLGTATGIPTSFSTTIDEVSCGDIDNDGDIDILLVGNNRSFLYYNQLNSPTGGVGTGSAMDFVLDGSQSFNSGNGEGTTMVDIDDDGDLDIYMNINGGNNQLWINNLYSPSTSETNKDYLFVEVLEDRSFMQTGKKRPALGATVVLLDCDDNVLSGVREVNGGGGHGTQIPDRVHFGLPWGNNYNYKVLVKYPNYQNGGTTTRKEVIRWLNPSKQNSFPVSITVNATDNNTNCPPVLEICDNGLDDDGDGLIDCADTDCPSCNFICSDGVKLLAHSTTTRIGAGASNIPSISNLSVPAGNNRIIFVIASFEREHCQAGDDCSNSNTAGTGLGDNFAGPNFVPSNNPQITVNFAGSSGNVNRQNALTLPDGDLRFGFQYTNTGAGQIPANTTFSRESYFIAIYESELATILGGSGTGNINITLPDVNAPLDDADEAILHAYIFENVLQSNIGIVRSANNTTVNHFTGSSVAGNFTMFDSDLDNGQEPDEVTDGLLVLAISGLGVNNTGGFNNISGYTKINENILQNPNGDFTSNNEADGYTNTVFFRNGPSSGMINSVTVQSAAPSSVVSNGGQLYAFTIEACNNAEVCDNGTDDDGDGFIDCADTDCQPTISNVAVTQPTCSNKTSGQIIITASGSGTLSYSIQNETSWQSSNTFSNLEIGQYTIRVKNDSDCESEYTSNPIILDFGTCIEICNDGIDNDGDGKIDCDDPDCENVGTANEINN